MVINLLVVGNSEVEMFYTERKMLQEEYDVCVQVESRSGCRLEQCQPLIEIGMNENTNMIFIWALASWAWEEMSISIDNSTATVFKPANSFSLAEIPTIMSRINEYVLAVNPACEIFLVIPGVQDLYTFNQTLLEKAWGSAYKHFLEKHPVLNPINMRNHSIHIYKTFESLVSTEHAWYNKNLLLLTHVFNLYYSRHSRRRLLKGNRPPHAVYLSKRSLKLNFPLIPDGVHGSPGFLKFFMLRNKKLFRVYPDFWESKERDTLPAGSSNKVRTEETFSPRLSRESRLRFPVEDSFENVSKKRKVSPSLSEDKLVNSGYRVGTKPEDDVLYRFSELQQPSTSSVESSQTQPNNNYSLSLPNSFSPTVGSQPKTYIDTQPVNSSSSSPRYGQNIFYPSVAVQPRTDRNLTKYPEPLTTNWR